jgi:hypothetical protein
MLVAAVRQEADPELEKLALRSPWASPLTWVA